MAVHRLDLIERSETLTAQVAEKLREALIGGVGELSVCGLLALVERLPWGADATQAPVDRSWPRGALPL
mgnify:CR=1 FL=1